MTNKELWLRNYMSSKGLSPDEIDKYLALNDKCNAEGMFRKWRKQAPEEEKNREMETHYIKENSPNEQISGAHKVAHDLRMKQECNITMF